MRQISSILVASLISIPLLAGTRHTGATGLDAERSAALFVGIRDFDDHDIVPVRYALDDAIDLAYEFAVVHEPKLVPPARVALALSRGEPVKPASARKLAELLAAGATRYAATRPEIVRLIEAQARQVGRNGLFIVSFATHGVSANGVQQLLTTGSRVGSPKTTVTDLEIRDALSRLDVPRSLILIDACRERLVKNRRAGTPDPRSRFRTVLGKIEGQAVISAAANGGYAYDDDARRNGVFTAAVIDGLRCGAAKDWHHFVTVDTLHSYVSKMVLRWVRRNKDHEAKKATELIAEGEARKMPLSICVSRSASASPLPPE